jgi:long-chain acyl-CoA synthetase
MFRTIPDAIKYFAAETPDKTAIIEGVSGKAIAYGELWKRICIFAGILRDKGLKRQENVIMHTRQTIEHLIAFYGIQAAGGVAVPVDFSASIGRLEELGLFFDARYIISDRPISIKLEIINCAECVPEKAFDFNRLNKDGIAVIICTSGTTGQIKGVLSSFRCRFSGADNVRYSYDITADDIALVPQVLSHSGGLRRVEAMLVSGATAVIMNAAMFYGDVFSAIKMYNVTVLQLVPAQVAMLLQGAERMFKKACANLRVISVGSAVIPEAHKEKLRELFPKTRLFNDFGSTEAIGSAYFEWSAFPPKADCVGIESIHSKIVFLDGSGNPIINSSRDNPGIIATCGDTLMSGYWKNIELTEQFMQNGRVLSADLGYRGEDGMIYILGRKDDIIVSGANKISPHEIENALSDVVRECAVVAREDKVLGSAAVLFAVPKSDELFDAAAIQKYLQSKLERFKVPQISDIRPMDRLPRTESTGKVLRKELVKLI